MAVFQLKINGEIHNVQAESDTPLLWVLRDNLGYDLSKSLDYIGLNDIKNILDGD